MVTFTLQFLAVFDQDWQDGHFLTVVVTDKAAAMYEDAFLNARVEVCKN